MSQTLQNQLLLSKSMNGIISFDDGAGSTISNGIIVTNDLSGNNISTNSFSTNDLILPRKSTTALNTLLGSTIDMDLLIQNLHFNTSYRAFEIWNDSATGSVFTVDVSNSNVSINTNEIFARGFTNIHLISPDLQIIDSSVLFNNSTLTIPRTSTAALNTYLGSTINVGSLIQNLNFNTTTRNFEIWDDQATGDILSVDVSNNNIQMSPNTMSIFPLTALEFECSNTTFTNSAVSFPGSTVTIDRTSATYLGSTINLNTILSNLTFDTTNRSFYICSDDPAFSDLAYFDCSNNYIQMYPNTMSINPLSILDINCPNISFTNSDVSFPGSTVSFNSNLPTTTITTGFTNNNFITKGYGDATYQPTGSYPTLSGANAWTGNTNTFNSNLPTSTISTTTGGTQFITRAIGDGRFGQLAAANAWTGNTNTFNYNLPTSTISTTTGGTQFITRDIGDGRFGQLTAANAWTGNTNTFNSFLPTSTIVPTTNEQLTNKLYVDNKFGTVPVYVKNDANTNSFLLGSGSSIVTTGYYNFSGGSQALNYLTTGYLNVAIGRRALFSCQGGVENFGLGSGSLESLTSGSFNTAIGVSTGGNITTGSSNTFIGRYSGGALSTQSNNTFVGYFCGVNSTGEGNTIYGAYSLGGGCSGSSNTIIGFSSGTITNLTGSNNTIIGSSANLSSTTISNSCAIGTGAIATSSNQIMLGRATETVQVPGTLQISSVSAIGSTITVNNNIIHKKYYLSMVNPTVLTGTSPLIMSAPIYEYNQLNLASGTVQLPLSSNVEIGTVIRFRRITTMTGAINLEVQTGSGQAILGRNSITSVSIASFLAANVTYGSVVFLSSNLWSILD